jgi:glycosyltransferase involved in cell wall biosynthesis
MRIAQVSTVGTPVQETGSDSIESLVWLLSRELVKLGHEVTVFAAAGSEVPHARLITTLPGTYGNGGAPDNWQSCEWINLARAVERSNEFDILHAHAYLWGLPLARLSQAPLVHTLHITPYDDDARLRALYPRACVTALSAFQWSAYPDLRQAAVIHHGVDPQQFTFRDNPADYLLYIGRFIPEKGPVQAIELARNLGIPLVLAAKENDYFRQEILPLVDGKAVRYAGFVKGTQRDELLGGARALLYPLQAPEPFGLVLVEAMMCGTPVAAISLGAVPEVVDEGITGFISATLDQLPGAVTRSIALDRQQVRAQAIKRFSVRTMANAYVEVYQRLIEEKAGPGH